MIRNLIIVALVLVILYDVSSDDALGYVQSTLDFLNQLVYIITNGHFDGWLQIYHSHRERFTLHHHHHHRCTTFADVPYPAVVWSTQYCNIDAHNSTSCCGNVYFLCYGLY